ncbi:MAG: leucyl/phenylalanyl-tRNA--protein transferase [Flavobacteriaceae bacterium]|nr:leucyl/phenylalanyl-tRNA--protein transferase [Flavobacteriaceae bacterium]
MQELSKSIWFPNHDESNKDGLIAVGGDLSVERLMHAYHLGIFPWFNEGQPLFWWSPDPRMILLPESFKVSKSLKKTILSNKYKITLNTSFEEVINCCSKIKRKGQQGTWITKNMITAYLQLHKKGHAQSVEVWSDNQLVGGLYGIDLKEKKIFCGESMFSKKNNASKIALYYLVKKLKTENYRLIDCQMYTSHLESLGAQEIPRHEFLKYLK